MLKSIECTAQRAQLKFTKFTSTLELKIGFIINLQLSLAAAKSTAVSMVQIFRSLLNTDKMCLRLLRPQKLNWWKRRKFSSNWSEDFWTFHSGSIEKTKIKIFRDKRVLSKPPKLFAKPARRWDSFFFGFSRIIYFKFSSLFVHLVCDSLVLCSSTSLLNLNLNLQCCNHRGLSDDRWGFNKMMLKIYELVCLWCWLR